jgi:Flp pilus assembly protein TadD
MMKISRFLLVLTVMLNAACSSLVQDPENKPAPEPIARALSGELILGRVYTESELPNTDLFGLSAEMRRFVDETTAGQRTYDSKAEAIHNALLNPTSGGGRGITYSAETTNTGIDAFEARQANCLSYTLLYVAMAKYAGLDAYFNEVMLPPTWDMRGDDTYLFMRHMNARVIIPKFFRTLTKVVDVGDAQATDIIVDLEMRRYRSTYKQHRLSNDQAASQYYSNRGMELAAKGDTKAAFLHLRKALSLAENSSYIWSNMGSLYRRLGFFPEAEAVYLQGLAVGPNDYTVMHNLTGLYKAMGNKEMETFYRDKVRRHRAANPYYQYKVAQDWMADGDYLKARANIEKALEREKNEPRFYRLAAEIYDYLKEPEKAAAVRKKLDKLY